MTTTTTKRWQVPGHPHYSFTADRRVFGPRGHELKQPLVGGMPAITVTNPKRTIYLAKMASQVWFGPLADDEELVYIDGDKRNWRLDNLLYKSTSAWWWSDTPTALEVEYAQIHLETLQLERMMGRPASTAWGAYEHQSPGCHGFTVKHS